MAMAKVAVNKKDLTLKVALFVSLLLFIPILGDSYSFSVLYPRYLVGAAAFSIMFVCLLWAWVLNRERYVIVLFLGELAIAAFFLFQSQIGPQLGVSFIYTLLSILFLLILLPAFFLAATGTYLLGKSRRLGYILLAASLFILAVFFFIGRLTLYFDDEEFIVMQSLSLLVKGINPYGFSFAKLIYLNATRFVPTLSTDSNIMGNLQYPPLFILSLLPFFLISPSSTYNPSSIGTVLAYTTFLFVLLVSIFLLRPKRERFKPAIAFFFMFAVLISYISSVNEYLIIALLLLAFEMIESKYAGIFLGLCLLMQELLWLPVLLLLVYLLANKGVKQAARAFALALGIFLAVCLWFIFTKPFAFFNSILEPLSKPLPSAVSPLGFLIIRYFDVNLSAFPLVFVLLTALFSLLLLYTNKKIAIPVFSIIAFLLLDHSITTYYVVFMFVFAYGVLVKKERAKPSRYSAYMHKHRLAFGAAGAALVLCIASALWFSHADFLSHFNIALYNQTKMHIENLTLISADLQYNNINSSIFVYAFAANKTGEQVIGLVNYSIIRNASPINCTAARCIVNTNRIKLQGSGIYRLDLYIPGNQTCVTPVLYSKNYYYVSKTIC